MVLMLNAYLRGPDGIIWSDECMVWSKYNGIRNSEYNNTYIYGMAAPSGLLGLF